MPKLSQDEKTLTEATLAANNTVSGTESHIKTVSQNFEKFFVQIFTFTAFLFHNAFNFQTKC